MNYNLSEYSNPNSPLHGEGYWIEKQCVKRGCECTFHVHSSWNENNIPKLCGYHERKASKTASKSVYKPSIESRMSEHKDRLNGRSERSMEGHAKLGGRGLYGRRAKARKFMEN